MKGTRGGSADPSRRASPFEAHQSPPGRGDGSDAESAPTEDKPKTPPAEEKPVASTGTIKGTVTQSGSGQPLAGVIVTVVGTGDTCANASPATNPAACADRRAYQGSCACRDQSACHSAA